MRRFLGITLLLLGLAQLGFRGMQRAKHDLPLWDFASVYASARTWIHGQNPYNLPRVIETWRSAGAFADRDASTWATVYPPTSLLMIAPIAILPAKVAMIAWLMFITALLMLQLIALTKLARLRWRDPRVLLLIGATIASAPIQFGLLSGQLSMPAISLCIIAFWCVRLGREKLAGVLIGIACAIKPQVAGPFLIYYFILRKRTVADFALLIGGAICLLSLIAMQLSHINWIDGWANSIADSARVGGVNDYGFTGTFRDEIVDLKILFSSIALDPLVVRIAIECIVIALIAWFVRAFPRNENRSPRNELLALATLSAISLTPIYHRVYDAALLTTALAWALVELNGARRRFATMMLVAMLPMLIPFDLVQSIANRSSRVLEISQTWWWQSLIAPHYAWGILALTIGSLYTMSRLAGSVAIPSTKVQPAGVFADDDEDEAIIA